MHARRRESFFCALAHFKEVASLDKPWDPMHPTIPTEPCAAVAELCVQGEGCDGKKKKKKKYLGLGPCNIAVKGPLHHHLGFLVTLRRGADGLGALEAPAELAESLARRLPHLLARIRREMRSHGAAAGAV